MKKLLLISMLLQLFVAADMTAQTKIACVGASITEGARLADKQAESYPGLLQKLSDGAYTVTNYGIGGTTMLRKGDHPYWETDAFKEALASKPDIVFIDLGGNDAKAVNRPYYEELGKDCVDMVRTFESLPSRPRVIVLLPTVSYETDPNQIWDPTIVDQVTPRMKKAAKANGIEFIEMHDLLADRPEMFPDKIHPDAEGHKMIAAKLYEYLQKNNAPKK